MPLTVASSAGFCQGVKRAVEGAMAAAEAADGYEVVSFGELAHNPEVISRLEKRGVTVIREPEEARGRVVLIRSHGVGPDVYAALEREALRVIDLTCPFVKRLHEIGRAHV